ncbi:MAG: heparinase II/III family protein [Pseudomonadota bacterium]
MSAPGHGPRPRRRSDVDDAALWSRFRGVAGDEVKASTVHRLKLASAGPAGFSLYLRDLAPPDILRGDALMRDVWRFGTEREQLAPGETPWRLALPSRHFKDRVHRFHWLPDLFAHGDAGADRAQLLVDDWIEVFGKFDGFAWRAGPTADRIWNWMRCGSALFDQGEEAARTARIEAVARQLRHLDVVVDQTPSALARWRGACVLVAAGICLNAGKDLDRAIGRLEAECTAQILPDGGHASRSPAVGLGALLDLLVLRDLFLRAAKPIPAMLETMVPRMAAMVQFFKSGDGALDPFNCGSEARPELVDAALNSVEAPPRRFSVAPKSGFQKLESGSVRLVLDAGAAPLAPMADEAHAGALGFELSDGPARLVTSCGYSPEVNVDWQAAVRRTGAHSTLTIAGRDSAVFEMREESRVLAPSGPAGISAKRLEEGEEIWLDAQHSGYKGPYGLLHRRRLFMSADGARITGEDSLVRPVSQGLSEDRRFINYELRFHIHPSVTALMGADFIRLQPPIGPAWRFKTSHAGARLEKTIYLGRDAVEPSEQIVLTGQADPNGEGSEPPNCVRWAFKREAS